MGRGNVSESSVPPPGSEAAIAARCLCPTASEEMFVTVAVPCPLHGRPAWEAAAANRTAVTRVDAILERYRRGKPKADELIELAESWDVPRVGDMGEETRVPG